MKSNINKSLKNDESFEFKAFSNSDYTVDRFNKKSIVKNIYIFVEESIA